MKINKTQALELLKKAGIPAKYRADVLHTLPHEEQFCGRYQTIHLFDREAVKKAAETFVIPTEPEFAPGNRVVFTVDLQEEDWFSDDVFSVKAGDRATVIGWEKGKIAVRDYETDRRWDVEPNQITKKSMEDAESPLMKQAFFFVLIGSTAPHLDILYIIFACANRTSRCTCLSSSRSRPHRFPMPF